MFDIGDVGASAGSDLEDVRAEVRVAVGVDDVDGALLWVLEVGVEFAGSAVGGLDVGDLSGRVSVEVAAALDVIDGVREKVGAGGERGPRARVAGVGGADADLVLGLRARVQLRGLTVGDMVGLARAK
ncbi:hypothetical protein [Cellulomonas sp. URHB0016]